LASGRCILKSALREHLYAHLLQLGPTYAADERAEELVTAATEGVGHILGCFGGAREGIKVTKGVERERRIMATERGKEWVGTPLDAGKVDPGDIVEITVEFEEGEEVLTPKANERFDSYDLNEAARYIFFLSNHIHKGGSS
jgi:hypothetical protein